MLGHALVASPRETCARSSSTARSRCSRPTPRRSRAPRRSTLAAPRRLPQGVQPDGSPQGVDQGKLTDFYGRVSRAHAERPSIRRSALLAAEVIGSIGNRASTLNTVINGWGNRAGLLAMGDLNVAIAGIAWAGGHTNAPPAAGKERMTWIGRNAEARELVVFSVSDAYADARARPGVGVPG